MVIVAVICSGLFLGFSQPFVVSKYCNYPIFACGYLGWLGMIGYVPALLFLRNKKSILVFLWAFLTGIVQFLIIFHWIIVSLVLFGHMKLCYSVFICVLLSSLGSFYTAFGLMLSHYLVRRLYLKNWIVNPMVVCVVVYISHYGVLGGCSWGNIG